MKNNLLFLTLILLPYILLAQTVTEEFVVHDGLSRSYILYVPSSYDGTQSVPLVLNLHGYSSNAGQQMIYSNFYTIADSEGFILIHPQGTIDSNGFQFWNSSTSMINGNNSDIDDVGFLSSLIDSIAFEYNINLDRIYSMGMSNGGFMSYTLGCILSDKIAAIASVTGSMTEAQIDFCDPQNEIPIMQIHGTADPTVLYEGSSLGLGIESIDNVVSYWVNVNGCNTEPVFNNVPDINLLDLCNAEHYVYSNGTNNSSVELYKIINGGHTWPGAAIPLFGNNTNQDFNASEKIWEFFNKNDLNGLINNSSIKDFNDIQHVLLKKIDILGRETNQTNQPLFYIYDDGTVKTKYLIQ